MAGCGCRGGRTVTCACVVRGDGTSVRVTGNGSVGSPYVVTALITTDALGSPTNMVRGYNDPRPARAQVWWYAVDNRVPVNFNAASDVLLGPAGFVSTSVAAVPAGVTLSNITGSNVDVAWGPVSNASFYEVHYAGDGMTTFLVQKVTGTSVRLDILELSGTVRIKVRAVNTQGPGLFSAEQSFVKPEPTSGGGAIPAQMTGTI